VLSNLQADLADCPVFLLAGGLGTRLRSVYNDGPKVLAPVNGQPFLGYILRSLATSGLRQVILCVGYQSDQIRQWLGDGEGFGLSVSYSDETQPLGTAGALRLAFSRFGFGRRFFAMNGDSILQLDLRSMYANHVQTRSLATVALVNVSDTSRYGAVDFGDSGAITSFREKGDSHSPGYINGGVYLFEAAAMDHVPLEGAVSLEREVLPALIGDRLQAFPTSGYFIDIGIPADFARAQMELKG
jgi:D-glycero-alpha-D-manno-heptose 1-phosphate guanylyltransferase